MRTWIALALLAAVAFSGCASEGGSIPLPAETDDTGGNETIEPDLGNVTVDNATNQPPVAGLAADVVNGTAPLLVNFTVEGSDADGDNLTWTLAVNGTEVANGTELPATVVHNFTEAGNVSVRLTVSDGSAHAVADLVLSVAAGSGGPAGAVHSVTGSTTLPGNPTTSLILGANGCAGFYAGETGQDCVFGAIPGELENRPYTFTSTAAAPYYEFWDACDAVEGTFIGDFSSAESGTLPSDIGCVVMWNYGDGTGGFTLEVL